MRGKLEAQRARCWSTEEVDPRQALAYWIDTVCDRFLQLEIDSPVRDRFRASLEQRDFGPTMLNVIRAESQRVQRTHAKIARSHDAVFFLLQLRAGHVRLRQRNREVIVRPGESVLISGAEPYEVECPQPTAAMALRIPDPWLRRWIPHPERHPAHLFSESSWNAALNCALASLDVQSCDELALPLGAVAEHVTALLALALGRDPGTGHPTLLDQLIRTLRDRLHEADLSPQVVAAQHGISKRTLHYAFAGARTTFVEQLMRLRLERAREILSDARQADLPMTEVAARCGFLDPSHFARRFRQRFAMSPTRFRRTMSAGGEPLVDEQSAVEQLAQLREHEMRPAGRRLTPPLVE